MLSTQERTQDGLSHSRADISLLDYRADRNSDVKEARYPHDRAGMSSGFRYQDLQVAENYRPKVQVFHGKPAKANAESSVELVSANRAAVRVSESLSVQATGYFSPASMEQLVQAIVQHLLVSGVITPQAVSSKQATTPVAQNTPRTTPTQLGLTERQAEVLRILAQGKSNKAIGRALGIAQGTVKIHVRAICEKLQVERRTEAIVAVNRIGLVL